LADCQTGQNRAERCSNFKLRHHCRASRVCPVLKRAFQSESARIIDRRTGCNVLCWPAASEPA
jgi:hypothetical protein